MDIIEMLNQYTRAELLIITPVLYVIARVISTSEMDNNFIPWILMGISIVLAGLYTFATVSITGFPQVLMALFTTLVQGILLSGTAIFGGILKDLIKTKKDNV